MADFKCEGCGSEKTIYKITSIYVDGEWKPKEAKCNCKEDQYMEQIFDDSYKGIPALIRTEPSLKK